MLIITFKSITGKLVSPEVFLKFPKVLSLQTLIKISTKTIIFHSIIYQNNLPVQVRYKNKVGKLFQNKNLNLF